MYDFEDLSPRAAGEPADQTGGARLGLRGRLLGAYLLVALITVGVGSFGIQRMSVLSDHAKHVYADGAVPLDGIRTLQADWWQFSAESARSNIPTLPPATIARSHQQALAE